MKSGFDAQTEPSLMGEVGLLLHCCCGPCASAVVERLLPVVRPTLYYYNPCIAPKDEYFRRAAALEQVAAHFGVELIIEEYNPDLYRREIIGFEGEREGGARCEKCFALRLDRSADMAAKLRLPLATTLTVSPHKNAPLINAIGESVAQAHGVKWIPSDFKKQDGYRRSCALSAALGLYRQNYCGCEFSLQS